MNDIVMTIEERSPLPLQMTPPPATREGAVNILCGRYDDMSARFVFIRPAAYLQDDLSVVILTENTVFDSVHLGTDNYFLIGNRYTQGTSLKIGVTFQRAGEMITHTNVVTFTLRATLYGGKELEPITLSDKAFAGMEIDANTLRMYNIRGEEVDSALLPSGGEGSGGGGGESEETADTALFLTPEVYATAGNALELYFEQAFRAMNPADYGAFVRSAKGETSARKWSYTPQQGDASSTANVEIYGRSGIMLAEKEITVRVAAPPESPQNLKLMLIGDSLSNPTVTAKFLGAAIRQFSREMVGSDTDVLTMVGTRGTAPENHEAFGGSQIQNYLSDTEANSFWDAGTGRTNFAAYTARTGIQPDIVHVLLGTNNVRNISSTAANPDALIDGFVSDMITLLKYMRQDWPDTTVFVGLPPYMPKQDAAGYLKRQFYLDRNFQRFCARLYERIGESFGATEKLITIPHNLLMDRDYGYGITEVPVSPYSTETVRIPADFVHPGEAGQKQLARAIVNAWAAHAQADDGGGEEGGDRVTVTNMLSNPGFDGAAGWAVLASTFLGSTADGILTQTGRDGGSATANAAMYQEGVPYPVGHVIYLRTTTRTSAGEAADYRRRQLMSDNSVGVVAEETEKTTDWSTLSGIFTAIEASNRFQVRQGRTATVAWDNETIDHKEPLAVDLTAAFGAGNEPDKAWCDANIPYFEGSVMIDPPEG